MASSPVLTVADLRAQSSTNWRQDVELSFPFRRGPPLKAQMTPGLVIPKSLFKFQLQQAVFEGTAIGGVRFMCRHGRVKYRKQAVDDSRKSKHTSCVKCKASVRFHGSRVTDDPSVALVVSATFKQRVNDPLTHLRNKFPLFKDCLSSEILGSQQFAFVFPNACSAEEAEILLQQVNNVYEDQDFVGKLEAQAQDRFVFSVYKLNLMHNDHLKPSLPSHRGMFMSYAVNQEVADMTAAGCSPAAIINYLTKSGKNGMISASKVSNLRATIASDISVYTLRPSSKESQCQSLLTMLDERRRQKRDVDFIFLYTEIAEDMLRSISNGEEDHVEYTTLRMQTGQGQDGGLSEGDEPPAPTSWLSALTHFFKDRWSKLTTVNVPPSRDRKKNPWFPHDRMINVRGRKCLLLAVFWCTDAEKLLFAKYPEVAGHDTKAAVCSTPTPFYYAIGYRDNLHTYVIFRGLVANETLGMFMFISYTVWVYFHGKKRISALRANMCDGKDEQIRALKSNTLPDGISPHAAMMRCGWHIENRGMHRIFGSATLDWQRAFEKLFWMWQTMETLSALNAFREWILGVFFQSKVVQSDMSANAAAQFESFVANLWSTRGEWSLAHNLEVQAFDVRANTFTEANFSVLTEHVGVSASMSASTFVRREDLSQVSRLNKLAHAAHRDATRSYSHVTSTEWTKKFEAAESVMLPKPLANLKNQVLLGASCARSAETKVFICSIDQCAICNEYLTKTQKKSKNDRTLKIHVTAYLDENLTKKVHFSHLPTAYVDLLRSAPRPKYRRVVTVNEEPNGCRLLCSCGYGMRNMTCCLHVSLIIEKCSNHTACGCEEEAIHIRHTNLFASLQDITKVQRTHDDWQGVLSSAVTLESVKASFEEIPADEDDDGALQGASESTRPHDHGTRHQGKRSQERADEAAYKSEKLGILRSRLFELLNIVESATCKDDIDKFCGIVDDGVFAIRRQLPALPARTMSTVAKRPASQPPRALSSRSKQLKKKAREAAAPQAMQQRARAAVPRGHSGSSPIVIGSSAESSGAESSGEFSSILVHEYGSDSDSQTSYSASSSCSGGNAYQ